MADFFDSYSRGYALGQQQKQDRQNRNMLAELQQIGPQVIAGDLAATDRAYALDPQRAQAYQAEGNRQQQQLFGLAKSLKQSAANPQMQAGIYRSAVPFLKRSFGAEIPDEFDAASVMPIVDQVLAVAENAPAMAGVGASQNKVVGGALVTPDGRVVYEAPVNGQVVDVPDGVGGSNKMIFDPRTRSLSPLNGGAPAARSASGTGPDGTPFVIGADLSPEQVAAAQRDIASGGSIEQVQLPDRGTGAPRLGYTPPKPRDAPAGYSYVGDTLAPIPGGPADNSSPQAQAAGEQGLRKEVSNLLKQDQSILSMYRNVQATSRNPSAAGDLSMIFAFMKMLDPGSVVREQEFANAQNAAGVPDQVVNAYNRALNGQRLNPKQREDFLRQAAQLAGEAENRITSTTRRYQDIAREYGYDPVRGTGMADFSGVSSSAESAQTPRGSESPRSSNIDTLLEKYR
ncbi:hypothetical protein LRM36_05150 [Stenotrophomonas maltophilia]|nr:hypothetical protein [Stenotrophomonas maltophilia]